MNGLRSSVSGHRIAHFRDLLRVLVVRDLKVRYKRSVLGMLWTLVNPLSQLLVFHFVFVRVFKVEIVNFSTFLFIGIVAWSWFSSSLLQATTAIVDNPGLIRRPGFPAAILPAVTISSHLVHFLMTLPILFFLMRLNGLEVTAALVILPLLTLLQFVLTLGMAYALASFHVFFRDTQYLLSIALHLGFFLTPIFYSVEAMPPRMQMFYRLNPMFHLIESYRSILMRGQAPTLDSLLTLVGFATVLLLVGSSIFAKSCRGFAEEL